MDLEAELIMLRLQNEELFAKLDKEGEAHRKASSRATATERQNKKLRTKIAHTESELSVLEQCWNCPDLGNRAICSKCSNSAVFEEVDGRLQWRGYPNERKEA